MIQFFFKLRERYPKDFTPKAPRNPIDLAKLAKFENGKLTNDYAWQVLVGYPDGLQVRSNFDSGQIMIGQVHL